MYTFPSFWSIPSNRISIRAWNHSFEMRFWLIMKDFFWWLIWVWFFSPIFQDYHSLIWINESVINDTGFKKRFFIWYHSAKRVDIWTLKSIYGQRFWTKQMRSAAYEKQVEWRHLSERMQIYEHNRCLPHTKATHGTHFEWDVDLNWAYLNLHFTHQTLMSSIMA